MNEHETLLRDYATTGIGVDPEENAMLRWAVSEIDRLRAELAALKTDDWGPPSDAMIELRDRAIDEHRAGLTEEFDVIGE